MSTWVNMLTLRNLLRRVFGRKAVDQVGLRAAQMDALRNTGWDTQPIDDAIRDTIANTINEAQQSASRFDEHVDAVTRTADLIREIRGVAPGEIQQAVGFDPASESSPSRTVRQVFGLLPEGGVRLEAGQQVEMEWNENGIIRFEAVPQREPQPGDLDWTAASFQLQRRHVDMIDTLASQLGNEQAPLMQPSQLWDHIQENWNEHERLAVGQSEGAADLMRRRRRAVEERWENLVGMVPPSSPVSPTSLRQAVDQAEQIANANAEYRRRVDAVLQNVGMIGETLEDRHRREIDTALEQQAPHSELNRIRARQRLELAQHRARLQREQEEVTRAIRATVDPMLARAREAQKPRLQPEERTRVIDLDGGTHDDRP